MKLRILNPDRLNTPASAKVPIGRPRKLAPSEIAQSSKTLTPLSRQSSALSRVLA
jgi:hypothetical protein